MKKELLFIALIIFSFKAVYSQDTSTPVKENSPMRIGINIAPGIAWIKPNSNNITSNGSKFGFLYGLIGEYYFTPYYGIASGIDVMYDGGQIQYNDLNPIKSEKYKLQYLEIPITLKLKTKEYGYLSYDAQFGLGISYNMVAKADYDYIGQPPLPPSASDVYVTNKDINMFRLSFIVSGGVEYSLTGNNKVLAGISFDNGLTNIIKGKPNKGINNLLSLNLGITF